MTGGRPRVAVVAAVDIDAGHGGAPLRARALRAALSAVADARYLRAHCEHAGRCRRPDAAADPFADYSCDRAFDRIHRAVAGWPADLVIVSELHAHRYATGLAQAGFRVVFDMHNVEYRLREEIAAHAPPGSWPALNFTGEHCAAVRRVEHDTVRAVDQVWTCSQQDKDAGLACYPDLAAGKVRVVPNAVELPAVDPRPGPPSRVVFTGRLDYYPNVEAAHLLAAEIAPRLRRCCPGLTVVVAGAAVTDETRDDPAIGNIVLVEDPAEIMSLITGGIMAVPLRLGGGTRFKILEALSVGSPVVSTAKGAQGLDLVAGTHYLAADTTEDTVAAIAAAAGNERLRADLARAGLDLVRRRYSIEAITQLVAGHLAAPGWAAPAAVSAAASRWEP